MALTKRALARLLAPFVAALQRFWRFIFQPAVRYPADPRAIFILILSVFSGGIALILEAGPATLEATLPRWGVMLWGVALVVGSVLTLIGMTIKTFNGIIIEQVGSVLVMVTTIYYASLVYVVIGSGAFQSMGIIAAWGLSCGLRWVQLQALIVSSYHTGIEIQQTATS